MVLIPRSPLSSCVVSKSLYILVKNKIFYKNSKNVWMAQKRQKQEGMSCGEVFVVCGF